MKLLPCPFCEGPPCLTAHYLLGRKRRQIFRGLKRYPRDGIAINAYVWCHECGAQGPYADEYGAYSDDDVADVKTKAAELWNQRDNRHRGMYDGGEEEGLNEYPRLE